MTTEIVSSTECFVTLKQIVDMINEERLGANKSVIRHDRSMTKVEELATDEGFGWVSKKDIQYTSGKGREDTLTTYCLTEEQAMIVASKIDNKRLIYVVKKLRELSKPKALPTNKELALMVIAHEEEKEKLLLENKQLETENVKIMTYARKELAPRPTITITEFSNDWIKTKKLSAQKITAILYGLSVYDGRYLNKVRNKICSHQPSTDYRDWFKPDIPEMGGGISIAMYMEYADKVALMIDMLTDDAILNFWEDHANKR